MAVNMQLGDGRMVSVTIPAGVRTGDTMMIAVPNPAFNAPAPVAQPPPSNQLSIAVPPGDHTVPMNVMVATPTGQQVMVTIPAG